MVKFIRANGVRLYAVLVAALALLVQYVPNLPTDGILGVAGAVLALLAGGEIVQRVENRKTDEALNTIPPRLARHRSDITNY